MRSFLHCFLLLHAMCICRPAFAQASPPVAGNGVKYMLCVGINNYLANTTPGSCRICTERGIKNLNGCLNDVDTISRIFIKYYDFKSANVHLLKDSRASRAAIIDSLQWLLNKCKKGDYFVFFYSGHGSYEYENAGDNQLQTGKGYRNTILPADIAQPGVSDINSAELNKIFSRFTAKGVVLTVITDCCHSATNTRGSTLFEPDAAREVKPSMQVPPAGVMGTGMTHMLDQSGALTIGSCQDNEIASEAQLQPKVFYGAFTISLCRAITEWSQAPVGLLLDRTLSKLRLLNKMQTPNMEGARRLSRNLAGTAKAQSRKASYTLKCLTCSANGFPEIAAGFTDDLYNNDILVDIRTKDSIRVNNVGLTETEVVVINQSKKLKAPDASSLNFMVLKTLANPDPPLKIFLGSPVGREVYNNAIQKASALLNQKDIRYSWMIPSLEKVPDAVLFYNAGWKLNRNGVVETATLDDLNAAGVNRLMDSAHIKNACLELPPVKELTEQLTARLLSTKNRNILVMNTASGADFVLAGHLSGGRIVYGWEKTARSGNVDVKSSGLPALTDFFPVLPGNLYPIDSLTERLNRLSVLANWLSMRSPPADKSLVFPYHLSVRNLTSKRKADDKVPGKSSTEDKLDIGIEKEVGSKLPSDKIPSLFIYVMSMDPKGNTFLLYPQPRTSVLTYPNAILVDTSYYHLATVRHTTPGRYHYFFIALREAVSSRGIFTRRGVVKGEQPEFSDNPLEALLNEGGTGQRGDIKSFDHWMLKTVDILTEGKAIQKK